MHKFADNVAPPPRPTASLPLEQLWTRLPQGTQGQLLGQLTKMLSQRLTPANSKEQADD